MKTSNKLLLLLSLFLVFCQEIIAQPFPLSITVQVNPPYTANYVSYFTNPNQISIKITNTSSTLTTYAIYLAGSISTTDGNISIGKSPEHPWSAPALNVPPGIHTYTGSDLQPFAQSNDVTYNGISQQDAVSGLLPEGEYIICLQAFGYETLTALSPGEPMGCSNVFQIQYPVAPQLISPQCNSEVNKTTPQNIIFSWLPPMGLTGAVQVRYRFILINAPDNNNVVEMLNNPVNPVYQEEVSTSTLYYGVDKPLLAPGNYAWRVQAFDPFNGTLFQNQGISAPCTFTFVDPETSGHPLTVVYPISGDTLPWNFMPIIMRFNPYSNDYVHFNNSFHIFRNGEGTEADHFSAGANWPLGPQQSQQYVVDNGSGNHFTITQEQSQHINLYKPIELQPHILFTEGNTYNWNSHIQIENSGGNDIEGDLDGRFVHGMGRPRPTYPKEKEQVLVKKEFSFQFITSAPPEALVPAFNIMQTGQAGTPMYFFNGGIDERWILEVSRDASFSTLVTSSNERIGNNLSYLNGACSGQCLIDNIYKTAQVKFTPNETGSYFWRVRWLKNPQSETGPSYLDGPTQEFIVKDELDKVEEAPPTPAECVSTCAGPIIPANEKIPVTTAVIGDIVKIGLFEMKITEIFWNGSSARGKGTIASSFLKAPIRVKFDAISINSNKAVYQGEVFAEYDNSAIIPDDVARGVTKISSITEDQALVLNNFVNSTGRLVSQFATDIPTGLPIGIDQNVNDQRVTIGIVGLKFTPEVATLNAMLSLNFSELHGWLSLGATNVCFHPAGLGGDGKGMLYLPLDHDIPFGDSITLRFDKTVFDADNSTVSDSGTYVSWDCRGFKALNIDGSVIFGRNILVEDLESGLPGNNQIKAEFSARIRRHEQWMARLNFNHPFQLKGVPSWGFDVEEAWLDFSDGQNPDGFAFPKGYNYEAAHFTGDVAQSSITDPAAFWKGFYLKKSMIRLPKEITTFSNPNARITGLVNNMLIDKEGLTASFRVENLVEVNDGNLAGWSFSIDTLKLDFCKGSMTSGGMSGNVRLPVSPTLIKYSALISQNEQDKKPAFAFRMSPEDTLIAPIWQSKIALAPTSYIIANFHNNSAFARAELTGRMNIEADKVNFKLIEFEELAFQSETPYIMCLNDCVRFAFASPQKYVGGSDEIEDASPTGKGTMSGFPVSITNIGLVYKAGTSSPEAGLQFTMNMNLTKEANTFSASTTMSVLGKLNLSSSQGQAWGFKEVELNTIQVSGKVGVVAIQGGLQFYENDQVYGTGIKGFVQAAFEPEINVKVAAQFGSKSGERYWFVDAQAAFKPGIPLITGLDVFGFGGGAYYHMHQASNPPQASTITTADTTGKRAAGMTLSGVNYVPDFSVNYGFKATVIFGNTGEGKAYNADVTFGAELSTTGGISSMYLNGNAYFMCDKTNRNNPQMHATANVTYDAANKKLDGLFDVYVRLANGLVKGTVNPNGLAGTAHIYADPSTWYIQVGNPSQPVGLEFADLFLTQSYLMVGKNLPPALPPPANVLSIIHPSTVSRNPQIENGNGFAFGARMNFETERLKFLIFSGQFALGMGFDISLMDYGDGVFCEGASPGTTIGADGWYAKGDVYAYVTGNIGIYVDMWGDGKPLVIPILDIGAAALLQGGNPNPTWLQGTCGGYYNVLAGAIKGNCQFEIRIGEPCTPAPESPMATLEIIGDMVPYNGEQNVDCGINPEVVFNTEVEKTFDLEEIRSDASIVMRRFRFRLERFELKKGGATIQSALQLDANNLKASLIPSAYLDPFTEYQITATVRGEEYNFSTSTWSQALKRDGSPIKEEKSNTFRTGAYPDHIPDEMVAYSYPFNTQRFFLQNECSKGVVKMKQWMAPLFAVPQSSSTKRLFKVRFIPIEGGNEQETELVLNESLSQLEFNIPPLLNSKVFSCQIIFRDSSTGFKSGYTRSPINLSGLANQQNSTTQENYTSQSGGAQIRSNRINGRTVKSNEKLLYVFFFKTSQYNSLQDKLNGLTNTTTTRQVQGSAEWLEPNYSGPEAFDVFDVNGFNYTLGSSNNVGKIPPLISMEESRQDNWNTTWANPTIYNYLSNINNTPNCNYTLDRSNPDLLGIPPFNTVRFHLDNPTLGGLVPSEFLPLSLSPGSVFSNLNQTQIAGITDAFSNYLISINGQPNSLILNVETGYRTWLDWQKMNTITNDLIIRFGPPTTLEMFPIEISNSVQTFLNTTYKTMYSGVYSPLFFFYPPNPQCAYYELKPEGHIKTYNYQAPPQMNKPPIRNSLIKMN